MSSIGDVKLSVGNEKNKQWLNFNFVIPFANCSLGVYIF